MLPILKRFKWCLFLLISMLQPACKHKQVNSQSVFQQYLKAHQVKVNADSLR
jgi:hypothetical protein